MMYKHKGIKTLFGVICGLVLTSYVQVAIATTLTVVESQSIGRSVPSTTTLISPINNISDTTPVYTWNAVPNATWYYLWVNDSTGNKVKTWYTDAQAGCANGIDTCSVTPVTPLASGSAQWWVQTWNTTGYGPWSTASNFSINNSGTPVAATLVSPNTSITNPTPTFTWNAVSNATWYYLWVNDSTGNKIKVWYTAAQAGCANGIDTCSVTPVTPLASGSAQWWVQTWNNAGYGLWSGAATFNVSDANYPTTTQLTYRPIDNSVIRPSVNNPTLDPVYNTRISMVNKSDDGNSSYPKVQSWNSNMSLLRIGSRFYNPTTLEETNITKNKTGTQAYNALCSRGSDDFRWSHNISDRFFVINSSGQFIQAEINGDTVDCSTVLDSFSEYEVIHMGPHEGNIDNNDIYVVFVAKKQNDTTFYVVLYNIQTGSRVWTKTMPSQHWVWTTRNGSSFWAPSTLDWLSVSQSGKYIVFNNDNGNRDGMYRYDINFENKTKLQYRWDGNGQLYSEGGHGDLGYDIDGNEVFVQFISGVGVYSFNLDNPTEEGKKLLDSPYGGGHISCRNTNRPGWCYVTANMDSNGNGLRSIFALKLDGTGNENVQNFSQTHINDGFGETYGGASPDGTKVIFNSHWNTNSVGTFIVEAQ